MAQNPRLRRRQKKRARRRLRRWWYREGLRRVARGIAEYIKDRLRQPSITEMLFPIVGEDGEIQEGSTTRREA